MIGFSLNKDGQHLKVTVSNKGTKQTRAWTGNVVKMLMLKLCHWERMRDGEDRRISQELSGRSALFLFLILYHGNKVKQSGSRSFKRTFSVATDDSYNLIMAQSVWEKMKSVFPSMLTADHLYSNPGRFNRILDKATVAKHRSVQ